MEVFDNNERTPVKWMSIKESRLAGKVLNLKKVSAMGGKIGGFCAHFP